MKRKIYVVGYADNYANWMQGDLVETIEEADLVLFTGGEDINPKYYDAPKHYTTSFNDSRDRHEIMIYNKAKELDKPCLGVCRGSQFLCVMSKGKLVQHQEHPGNKHEITTIDGKTIRVTSSHHQAQLPWSLPSEDYKILGWTKGLLSFHRDGNNDEIAPEVECEDVIYYKTKCLGIQSHPEWCFPPKLEDEKTMIEYYQALLTNFLDDKL